MKIIDVFRIRIVVFLIQISILILLIHLFDYKHDLNLLLFPKPRDTTEEQIAIIEWLSNYTLYEDWSDLFFIYTIWLLISIFPILIYKNYKQAYSMNFLTFFFPNFFMYTFLRRYYRSYFNANFLSLFMKTIILAVIIILFSIGLSLSIKKIMKTKIDTQIADLEAIARNITTVCPHCGTEFASIPKFCYNCNLDLTIKTEDKNG